MKSIEDIRILRDYALADIASRGYDIKTGALVSALNWVLEDTEKPTVDVMLLDLLVSHAKGMMRESQ